MLAPRPPPEPLHQEAERDAVEAAEQAAVSVGEGSISGSIAALDVQDVPNAESSEAVCSPRSNKARRFSVSSYSSSNGSRRRDSFSSLSASGADLYNQTQHHEETNGLPSLLIAFVCAAAALSGLVVALVHKALVYAGCPLGVNGCNEFLGMERKGFLLVKWTELPESLVNTGVSILGALAYGATLAVLPQEYVSQVHGGGTFQSLAAVASGKRIPFRMALLRICVTSVYLGSGGTLGGEGPAIQVCTSLTMFVGWHAGIRSHQTQSLMACLGISCGFAASFNSPLAGILFAMEELQHVSPSLSKTLTCSILVASVVATATNRALHGNTQVFTVDWTGRGEDLLFGKGAWTLVALPIGALCALVSALITLAVQELHKVKKTRLQRLPPVALLVSQAALVGCLGTIVFHATGLRGVWGIGAGSLQETFEPGNTLQAWEYVVFALGKMLAMILAVSVRAPGDVLEPVLISGGFIGGCLGTLAAGLGLISTADVPSCIIFGMVGLFAACFRFPLTPVVIVLELVGIGSYSIILPTALASFTAITLSSRLCSPLLHEIMHQEGLDLQDLVRQAAAEAAQEQVDEENPQARGGAAAAGTPGEAPCGREASLVARTPSLRVDLEKYLFEECCPGRKATKSPVKRWVEEKGASSVPLPALGEAPDADSLRKAPCKKRKLDIGEEETNPSDSEPAAFSM